MTKNSQKMKTIAPYSAAVWNRSANAAINFTGGVAGLAAFVVTTNVNPDFFSPTSFVLTTCGGIALSQISLLGARYRKRTSLVSEGTKRVNAAILEITGDSSQKLSEQQVQEVMRRKSTEPIRISGVEGIELTTRYDQGSHNQNKRELAVQVKEAGNGIESFDHLIEAAIKRNPDIAAVASYYRTEG